MLEHGTNIRKLQVMLGHNNLKTNEIYTHVMDKYFNDITSPLDVLNQKDDKPDNQDENN